MSRTDPSGELPEADREHVIELLREHFAAGTLDVAEFGRRVEVLLTATTTEQATAAVDDLAPLNTSPRQGSSRSWWHRMIGRRHAQADAAQAGWLPTTERFRDPSSRALIRVWMDPADHSRHYVPEQTY